MFYRMVIQAVLLFGLGFWVMLSAIQRIVESKRTGFLQYITGNQAPQNPDWTCVIPEVGEVLG